MKRDAKYISQSLLIAWMAWQSGMLISILSRVSVLEDRSGIHVTQYKAAKKEIWSDLELFHVPELVQMKR